VALGDFAAIYRGLAKRYGWTPREADEVELWEAAILLDLAPTDPTDLRGTAPDDPRWGGDRLAERASRAAAVKAARADGQGVKVTDPAG
jgi:hypothetical protein